MDVARLLRLGLFIWGRKLVLITALVLNLFIVNTGLSQQTASTILKSIIEGTSCEITVGTEKVANCDQVILFYQRAEHKLVWQDGKCASDMVQTLLQANVEGLNPADYHANILDQYHRKKVKSEEDRAYFDVLLTDAFLSYSAHLLTGRIDPEQLYPGKWTASRRSLDLSMLLSDALLEQNIASTLEGLDPVYVGYEKLKTQLKFFRSIQSKGGWTVIPEGALLTPGDEDERISLVRKRLLISGQLTATGVANNNLYDSMLYTAIKKLQKQHGLHEDGVIGKHTLGALNYSPEDYIRKIAINMERYRWLPWELGDKYVRVNIPDFQLTVFENDSIVMSMKIIVGKPDRSTPVFSSVIRYLVLNPTWTVPPTILKEDVLPAVKQNVQYLTKHNLRVINRAGEEVNPAGLPWESYTEKNFPYQLRQDPGLYNSMGLIKFQFPNQYRIFLHDTNMRSLFSETFRALSSGCIRIEQPFTLAAYLLDGTKWTRKKIDKEVSSGKTITIPFLQPVPVHLLYLTAFVDDENFIQIRDDIYDLDRAVQVPSAVQIHE